MKTFIFKIIIVLTLLTTESLYCQLPTITQLPIYTSNLNSYVGKWEYTNGNVAFIIYLQKGKEDIPVSIGECLIGDYYYKKDGIILDNYESSQIPIVYNNTTRSNVVIYATNGKYNINYINPLKLRVYFNDKRSKTWTGSGSIELISPTQIHWVLKGDEGVYDNEEISKGFSVPTDVIMNKK